MNPLRRKADREAIEVEVKADDITAPEYFPGRKTDGRNRSKTKGNVEIAIRKQHKGVRDEEARPPAGTVLVSTADDETIIETRRIQKVRRTKDKSGRKSTTASDGVKSFVKLRRQIVQREMLVLYCDANLGTRTRF